VVENRIARYYFYSVTGAVAPLLKLTNSGSGSDAINKVAVAHLCRYLTSPLAKTLLSA